MAPILLACPTCKKQVSSSAQSCPNCGEVLTDDWEEKGLKKRRRRRIGWAVVLLLVGTLFGAPLIAVSINPNVANKTAPSATSDQPTVQPKSDGDSVRAFGFRTSTESPGLFVKVRTKVLDLKGFKVTVLCPADGTGEVVAAVSGEYVAINGAARGWAARKAFWAVLEAQMAAIIDFGYPNNVPKRLQVLEPHVDAIIEAGVKMCPLASPAGDSAFRALQAAQDGFAANARRLGVTDR